MYPLNSYNICIEVLHTYTYAYTYKYTYMHIHINRAENKNQKVIHNFLALTEKL